MAVTTCLLFLTTQKLIATSSGFVFLIQILTRNFERMRKLLVVLVFAASLLRAQVDSNRVAFPLVAINFSGQLPLGDMAARFGVNLNAGGTFLFKTKSNWLMGVEGNYIFGRNVKEDVLKNLKNDDGFVVDNEGYPADIRVTERGVGFHALVGKLINVGHNNQNSGIIATVGVGYLQHKINIYDAQTRIAAVSGDLKYGYDRLSRGISFTQFIGYLYLSDNRMLNFYFGVEAYQAFTKSVRKFNYDTGLWDTKQRFDGLLGLRLGWILPLYKKVPNEYYYY